MPVLAIILIAAAIIVVLIICGVAWFLRGQNRLVHAEELCGNALSQIGVQQQSRWDALNAMADLTKTYSDSEYKTIMDTIAARQGVGPKSTAQQVQQQEDMLKQGFGRVNAVAEAYPELKSNALYLKAMDEVRNHEDNVRMSRMVYNDTVTKYNRLVRSLPGSLLAGGMGFAPRDYLQADDSKAEMPVMAR